MADTETPDPSKGGRPSHADKIAQLEQNQESLFNAVVALTERVQTLEERPEPAPFVPTAEQEAAAADEYCVCGSRLGSGHFEGPDGPCPNAGLPDEIVADQSTITAAETALV